METLLEAVETQGVRTVQQKCKKGPGLGVRRDWVRTLVGSHSNCLVLGKLLKFSEPHFLSLERCLNVHLRRFSSTSHEITFKAFGSCQVSCMCQFPSLSPQKEGSIVIRISTSAQRAVLVCNQCILRGSS